MTKFPRPCLRNFLELTTFMIFLRRHVPKHFVIVRQPWGIFEWGILHVVTRWTGEMMYEPRFTHIHSSEKEMQLPNLLVESVFVILMWRPVLKRLVSLQEPWETLEWFLLAHCYQEHSGIATRSVLAFDIWSNIKWRTLFPKREATSENLHFFWGRVYVTKIGFLK